MVKFFFTDLLLNPKTDNGNDFRYYVNTRATPPITTWTFPTGPSVSPIPQPQYAPPQTAPPPSSYNSGGGYNQGSGGGSYKVGGGGYDYDNNNNHGTSGYGGGNSYPQQQQPQYGGYNNDPRNDFYNSGQNSYGQTTQNSSGKGAMGAHTFSVFFSLSFIKLIFGFLLKGGLLGGLLGGKLGSKPSGGGSGGLMGKLGAGRGGGFGGGGGYPQQTVYQQGRPPKKSGMGMGGMALGGKVFFLYSVFEKS